MAGAVGTAAMTGWQELAGKLRSDGSGGGGEAQPSDPWANAPAPAKVGRMILSSVGYEVPADQIDLLTNVMHWGYGTTWGAVYGVLNGGSSRRRPLIRGLAFGTVVWAMSYVELVPLGLYEPPWKYPPEELAFDLSYHLAYGAGLGVGGALVGA
jgi:hypothetical protein